MLVWSTQCPAPGIPRRLSSDGVRPANAHACDQGCKSCGSFGGSGSAGGRQSQSAGDRRTPGRGEAVAMAGSPDLLQAAAANPAEWRRRTPFPPNVSHGFPLHGEERRTVPFSWRISFPSNVSRVVSATRAITTLFAREAPFPANAPGRAHTHTGTVCARARCSLPSQFGSRPACVGIVTHTMCVSVPRVAAGFDA